MSTQTKSSSKPTGDRSRKAKSSSPWKSFIVVVMMAASVFAGVVVAQLWKTPGRAGDITVNIPKPNVSGNDVDLRSTPRTVPSEGEPIQAAIGALIATSNDPSNPGALPVGTRLLSAKQQGDLVTLDFSAELAKVNEAGSTGESLAQNAIRKVLQQFPTVKRLTVSVEGRVFEGEHAGPWAEIPVPDGPPDQEARDQSERSN